MKYVLSILLVAIIAFLGWLLVVNIQEPIAFQKAKTIRETAVRNQLIKIRTAQELYREITGKFAGDFDSLKYTLQNDSFMVINVIGDKDDPSIQMITYDTTFYPAADSVRSLGFNLDSLRYVPYGNGAQFQIQADTIEYQKTNVNVVEVGVEKKVYMGPYGDPKFAKYDNNYDPNTMLKFGDMTKPNTSGNWER